MKINEDWKSGDPYNCPEEFDERDYQQLYRIIPDPIFNEPLSEFDKINFKAYVDVLEHLEPTMPENELYMQKYKDWRTLADWPEDKYEDD